MTSNFLNDDTQTRLLVLTIVGCLTQKGMSVARCLVFHCEGRVRRLQAIRSFYTGNAEFIINPPSNSRVDDSHSLTVSLSKKRNALLRQCCAPHFRIRIHVESSLRFPSFHA